LVSSVRTPPTSRHRDHCIPGFNAGRRHCRNRRQNSTAFAVLAARYRKPLPSYWASCLPRLQSRSRRDGGEWWARSLARRLCAGCWRYRCSQSRVDAQARQARCESRQKGHYGVFALTLAAFFIARSATRRRLRRGARRTVSVSRRSRAGHTLGMMIANVPVVVLGNAMAHRIPLRAVHIEPRSCSLPGRAGAFRSLWRLSDEEIRTVLAFVTSPRLPFFENRQD